MKGSALQVHQWERGQQLKRRQYILAMNLPHLFAQPERLSKTEKTKYFFQRSMNKNVQKREHVESMFETWNHSPFLRFHFLLTGLVLIELCQRMYLLLIASRP